MPTYTAGDIAQLLESRKAILNIGPGLTGKTYSLWTLVAYLKERNLGKLHYFDLDHKVESLVLALREEPEAKKMDLINYIVIRRLAAKPKIATREVAKVSSSKDLFEDFMRQINEYENQIDIQTGNWKTDFDCGAIIGDSLTRYNDIVQEFVVATTGHDIGAAGSDARNDYTMIMNKVKQVIQGMKGLPCITGWMAHDMIVKNDIDGKVVLIPNCAGHHTLAPNLPTMFNVVVVSTTQEEKIGSEKRPRYVWQIQPGGWVRSAGVTSRKGLPQFVPQDYRQIL